LELDTSLVNYNKELWYLRLKVNNSLSQRCVILPTLRW